MNLIEKTPSPRTRSSLREDFLHLGLKEGMTVIVHSSLKSIGWTVGGAVAVVQALMDVITEEGTLVMPAQSGDYSDPSKWMNPPVPKDWWETIKAEMPVYDPAITPLYGMGAIPETFLRFPGVIRSDHPTVSFAAWGKQKKKMMNQSLDFALGEESPLAELYNSQAHVLLLGAGYDSNTSMHLAEHRIPPSFQNLESEGSPVLEDGKRVWKTFQKIEYRDELFEEIGADFEKERDCRIGKVGSATARLMEQKLLVDYTEKWLTKYLAALEVNK